MHGHLNSMTPDESEEWRSIPGWDAYEASNLGRVRRVKPSKGTRTGLLKGTIGNHGYRVVALCQNGRPQLLLVHRLVADTFIGLTQGQHVDHRDGDKTNNELRNLRPCTLAENNGYGAARGVYAGERSGGAKLTNEQVLWIHEQAPTVPRAILADHLGVGQSTIYRILRGARWPHLHPSRSQVPIAANSASVAPNDPGCTR